MYKKEQALCGAWYIFAPNGKFVCKIVSEQDAISLVKHLNRK